MKKQIFILLSSLCLYSDDGHARVVEILQAFKVRGRKGFDNVVISDSVMEN